MIEHALKVDPENAKALQLAGSASFEAKDYKKAIGYWQRVLKQVPADSEAGEGDHLSNQRSKDTRGGKQVKEIMSRENLLFAIIGILLGFIVGFMLASSMSQKTAPLQAAASAQGMPADHPPIGAAEGSPDPQAMRAEVAASLEKARNEPKNFEAQIKAAELYYQIQRYDQAIKFLLKANEIQPTDYKTVVALGMVNLDAEHYDTAEKWYRAAMKMKSDDVMVLCGTGGSHFAERRRESGRGRDCKTRKSRSQQPGPAAVPRQARRVKEEVDLCVFVN